MPSAVHTGVVATGAATAKVDVTAVHAAHGDFVWASLQRLGARESDLEDLFQEVFVVVHQRLATFEGNSTLTTWLFGICLRVVANYRRRAYIRREQVTDPRDDDRAAPAEASPEHAAVRGEARAKLRAVLDEMDLEKRAVFVMYEVEEMPCEQIAAIVGAPIGTVYSRLHAARKQVEQILHRHKAREQGRARR